MTKYRAKVDVPPNVKAGDIVDFKEKLVPEYEKLFEPVINPAPAAPEDEEPKKSAIINPDRNELKERAAALGLTFASNIPTDRLLELVIEAEEKKQAELDAANAGEGETPDDEDKSEDDKSGADDDNEE